MKKAFIGRAWMKLAMLAALLQPGIASAQFFTFTQYGDLMAGFRKTGAHQGNYELVVYLGNVTNFVALPIGTTINMTNYSGAQLTNAFPDNFANLQWSVFSAFKITGLPEGPWKTPVGSFPKATCWYTFARTNTTVQSAPPPRWAYNQQGNLRGRILPVSVNAGFISNSLGVTNVNNNAVLVREPLSYSSYILTASIGDQFDPTFGDFYGNCLPYSVENTTPDPFSSPAVSVSDLYQSCPYDYADPLTGLTNGSCTFLGYFTLSTDGTMTFTRAASSPPPPPPPPSQVTIIVIGGGTGSLSSSGTNIVSFLSTNGATYTLHFTNSPGLSTPTTNWPALPTILTGNGMIMSFTDLITAPIDNRFYRVGAH